MLFFDILNDELHKGRFNKKYAIREHNKDALLIYYDLIKECSAKYKILNVNSKVGGEGIFNFFDGAPECRERLTSCNYSLKGNLENVGESTIMLWLLDASVTNPFKLFDAIISPFNFSPRKNVELYELYCKFTKKWKRLIHMVN